MTALPQAFTPGANDDICGRGRKAINQVGNERFRQLVESRLAEYSSAAAKLEKSYILSDIVCEVRQRSPQGGFVKRDAGTGAWYEVGDFLAREKTSQAFRDALHDQYKSSNTAKKKRRQAEQAEKQVHEQGSSTSLCFDPNGSYNLTKPPMMPPKRFDQQDTLLGSMDSRGMMQMNVNHATSRQIVDFSQQSQYQHRAQQALLNQSCPNLRGWNGQEMEVPPQTVEDFNRSAPHMEIDTPMSVMSRHMTPPRSRHISPGGHRPMSSPHARPSSHRALSRSSTNSDFMEVEPVFSGRSPGMDDMGSESFGDDLILSPIGDGSPRRLFNSLSKLTGSGTSRLSAAPMLE